MIFSEKLQILRKNKGYTQEALADKLGVSRQAVAKWESGQIYPDISNLIQISDLMSVSVDYLVKDQDCVVSIKPQSDTREVQVFNVKFRKCDSKLGAVSKMIRVLFVCHGRI